MALCAGMSIGSGYDGIGLGLSLVVTGYRTVVHVERELAALANLEKKIEERSLAQSCIFSDARSFDGRAWRHKIHIITAGYPCQPFSLAGKRQGTSDPRHLWPTVQRIIGEVRPPLVFLENVHGHLSLGFDEVTAGLAEVGYDATWTTLSAAEVGASHRRNRLWCLAYDSVLFGKKIERRKSDGDRESMGNAQSDDEWRERSVKIRRKKQIGRSGSQLAYAPNNHRWAGDKDVESDSQSGRDRLAGSGYSMADAGSGQLSPPWRQSQRRDGVGPASEAVGDSECWRFEAGATDPGRPAWNIADNDGSSMGDARGEGLSQRQSERQYIAPEQQAAERTDNAVFGIFPPGPNDRDAWESILQVRPDLEPAICRVAYGTAGRVDRVDRLRLLGNGVVPLVAAVAFAILYRTSFGCWPWAGGVVE